MPSPAPQLRRRDFLGSLVGISAGLSLRGLAASEIASPPATASRTGASLSARDLTLLRDLIETGCRFFLENTHPRTGLVKDRSAADGPDSRSIASTAATGFGLTAICIAAQRHFIHQGEAEAQALRTLRFLQHELPHEHGFHYHFLDAGSGERAWSSEASSIDTALLLAGVLCCREYFKNAKIRQAADAVFQRVEWTWLLGRGGLIRHGYRPEQGRLRGWWEAYCEHMILYLMALGSPTHPIPATSWSAWSRPVHEWKGTRYIGSDGPLFVHQYSHAWIDFRGIQDAYADYHENSVIATRVHREFCLSLRNRFPKYSEDLWGITASDSATGYQAWGGPPESGRLDGSIVPCAAAGSLPFEPQACLRTLHAQLDGFGGNIWKRYGFVDAFNPHNGWVNPDVIGIDVGVTLLMAENLLSGSVWRWMQRNPVLVKGLERAGFHRV